MPTDDLLTGSELLELTASLFGGLAGLLETKGILSREEFAAILVPGPNQSHRVAVALTGIAEGVRAAAMPPKLTLIDGGLSDDPSA